MAIKFSQFNLRTDHTSGMYLVGYDGNQNIHITVDNLFDDFINGTENTIAMFGTNGLVLADSILSQDAGATLLTVAGQLNVDANATFDTNISVTGASALNGNVTLGSGSTNQTTSMGTLVLTGPVRDTTYTLGTADQVLLSNASGKLTFTDLSDLHVGGAEVVEVPVKNVQGSALVKGDPVYISGSVGASGRLEVQLADASNTLKMPAVGLLKQDLADNAEGFAVVTGKLRNLITDPIDGVNPTENDVIYVKPSGTSGAALTTTKPVYGNFIQNVGKVGRVSTSNDGNFVVSSILRTNDIPNLTPGRLWIGSNGNTIESQTLFVDEASGRLGVGTTSPEEELHVSGTTKSSTFKTGAGSIVITGQEIYANDEYAGDDGSIRLNRFGYQGGQTKFRDVDIFDGKGTSIMKVDGSSGNVGIGTTSPGSKLHVSTGNDSNSGNIEFVIGGTNLSNARTASLIKNTSSPYELTIQSSNNLTGSSHLIFKTSGSDERMRIRSDGNVGIGTTNPERQLSLYSDNSETTPRFLIEQDGTGDAVMAFSLTGGQGWSMGIDNSLSDSFMIHNSSGGVDSSSQFTIDTSGNVGIGTVSPSQKLEIRGETATHKLVSIDRPASDVAALYIGNDSASPSNGIISSNYSDLIFGRDQSGVLTEHMRIERDGNVGIGTTSPSQKLQVEGGDISGATIAWKQANRHTGYLYSDSSGVGIYDAALNNAGIYLASNSRMDFRVNGSERMRIDSSGFVGIGTASPTRPLHVNGAGTNFVAEFQSTDDKASILIQDDDTLNYIHSQDGYLSLGGQNALSTSNLNINSSNGRVGIGTINPATRLHVQDDAYIQNGNLLMSSGIYGIANVANTIQKAGFPSSGNFAFQNVNVGIGTTSPSAKLAVDSGSNSAAGYINIDSQTFNRLKIGYSYTDAPSGVGAAQIFVDSSGNLDISSRGNIASNIQFYTSSGTSPSEVMRINSSGNVGIGTTSPNAGLSIVKSGLATQLRISTTEADSTIKYGAIVGSHYTNAEEPIAGILMTSSSSSTGGSVSIGGGISAANAVNNVIFYTAANNTTLTGSERMRITSDGNVGIGTTSPASKFHVYNNDAKISSDAGITVEQDGTGDAVVQYLLTGTKRWVTGIDNSDGDKFKISHSIDLSTDNVATFTADNRVGIGTTSPASKLDVNGGIRMADDSSTASATNVGTLRYRTSGNNSYVDMCMQTGASTYAWVNIVQNNW